MHTVRTGRLAGPAPAPMAAPELLPLVIGPAAGLVAQLLLLAVLTETVNLSSIGWLVGSGCGAVVAGLLCRGLIARDRPMGPADWVTSGRAVLVGGITALVADSFVQDIPLILLIVLSAIALALDSLDGKIARLTGTVSELGARFDMEVDAFLILVLGIFVAPTIGWWVIAIGAMRYLFVAAGWLIPWLHEPQPFRYWAKVVAAIQGIVLAVAAAGILPQWLSTVALAVALLMLVESFGHSVRYLWGRRAAPAAVGAATPVGAAGAAADQTRATEPAIAMLPDPDPVVDAGSAPGGSNDPPVGRPVGRRSPLRRIAAAVLTVLAALLVWFALVAPNQPDRLEPGAFVRIPVEGLVVLALALIVPRRPRRVLVSVVGIALGLLTVVKLLDLGFYSALDRPFNPLSDWAYLDPAIGVLRDSIGGVGAIALTILVAGLVAGIVVFTPLSVRRLTRASLRHRTASSRAVAVTGLVWIGCALLGVQIAPNSPVASAGAADLAVDQVSQVRSELKDQRSFAGAIAHDPISITPASALLTGLRGKDVIFAFVESYGRVAVQDSALSVGVDRVLDTGTRQLRSAGFAARSGFLTSPTFGGISWLAHSTLQSGLWIDSQLRYDELVASDRFTLSGAFRRAGWRTIVDIPANYKEWPAGESFYHYDKTYDAHNVGYARAVVQLREHARPVRAGGAAAAGAGGAGPLAGDGGGRPGLQPYAVDAAADARRLEVSGRRRGLRRHARPRTDPGAAVERRRPGAGGLRAIDPVLTQRVGLVRDHLRQQRSGPGAAR